MSTHKNENAVKYLHDNLDSLKNKGNSFESIDLGEEDIFLDEQFGNRLLPINSRNLFGFFLLLIVLNAGLAIVVMIN
ncbi:MAG: hypothetical protein CVU84_04080 [Firmicutes bacterium HGW-Firmicutes-1]|jgi:hypothetical protein|nr:MAG: hypothetical protein CVU84_04080 [Firmicutes bacterium HGW-Firmicutes-1]